MEPRKTLGLRPLKPIGDFWVVWRFNSKRCKHRHLSFELAKAEADRLNALNPDKPFYVLKAVHLAGPEPLVRS